MTVTFSDMCERAARPPSRRRGGFEQAALPLGIPVETVGGRSSKSAGSAEALEVALRGPGSQPSPHLLAARRLSRRIRRLPDHSDEQTQTGLAIFQHLRLLLAEEGPNAPPH